MAEVNPPYVLHNAGTTHTAEGFRMALAALTGGFRTSGSLVARGGVRGDLGGGMVVTASGSPSLALNVASGVVIIPGSEGTKQGVYICVNDATEVVTMAAAHASLPRIDLVVARIQDSFYSGASDTWTLEPVTGTANSTPVAPSAPANSIILATITRSAADDTIASGDIADSRPLMVAAGGVHPVHSSGKTALLTRVGNGAVSVETDTGRIASVVGGAWVGVTGVDVQVFTANGTWTKPAGAQRVRVRCVGGGGAGGGAGAASAAQNTKGGGGGGGECREAWFNASSLGATVAVTIGAAGTGGSGAGGNGGNTTFGAHVTANGGSGGGTALTSAAAFGIPGGAGGSGGSGGTAFTGTAGGNGFGDGGLGVSGQGGSSGGGHGGGAIGRSSASAGSSQAGATGGLYGGGGGGALVTSTGSAANGGSGAAGLVVVETYL
jgi:hypothetical protein